MENNEFDFKVVTFKNISDFKFTPALGAMFNSRPIFGKVEKDSIVVSEELLFPYHIGRRLAINLAKQILLKEIPAPTYGDGDPARSPAVFGDEDINNLVTKILIGEYQESSPVEESETDKLMKKFDELNKTVEGLKGSKVSSEGFQDKQQVIAELEKREIVHDKRQSKATLEKLLA